MFPAGAAALPGDLDPTFSGDGFAFLGFDGLTGKNLSGGAGPMEVQPDGRIVVATSANVSPGPQVARAMPDGTLDRSWAGDGQLSARDLPDGHEFRAGFIADLALDPEGRTVLAGSDTDRTRLWLARLTAGGELDGGFGGGDGVVIHDLRGGEEELTNVEVQPDGRIVAVGGAGESQLIARFAQDGQLDPSFSGDGLRIEPWAPFERRYGFVDLALRPDGRIVAYGPTQMRLPDYETEVRQYTPGGEPDPSFSGDGSVVVGFGGKYSEPRALVLDEEGRALLLAENFSSDYEIHRLSAGGEPDATFGTAGAVKLTPPPTFPGEFSDLYSLNTLILDDRARMLVVGNRPKESGVVGRVTAEGTMDQSFSGDGWASNYTRDGGFGFGDIEVAGEVLYASGATSEPGLARFELVDGPLDADADGVLDSDDECPFLFEDCPPIGRRVTLRRKQGAPRVLKGKLHSPDTECSEFSFSGPASKISIFRVRKGSDTKVGRADPHSLSGFSFRGASPDRRYYAVVQRKLLAYGECPRERSRAVPRASG